MLCNDINKIIKHSFSSLVADFPYPYFSIYGTYLKFHTIKFVTYHIYP